MRGGFRLLPGRRQRVSGLLLTRLVIPPAARPHRGHRRSLSSPSALSRTSPAAAMPSRPARTSTGPLTGLVRGADGGPATTDRSPCALPTTSRPAAIPPRPARTRPTPPLPPRGVRTRVTTAITRAARPTTAPVTLADRSAVSGATTKATSSPADTTPATTATAHTALRAAPETATAGSHSLSDTSSGHVPLEHSAARIPHRSITSTRWIHALPRGDSGVRVGAPSLGGGKSARRVWAPHVRRADTRPDPKARPADRAVALKSTYFRSRNCRPAGGWCRRVRHPQRPPLRHRPRGRRNPPPRRPAACPSDSTPSGRTTCPASTPSPPAPTATEMPSSPARPCPGARASWKVVGKSRRAPGPIRVR